MATTSYSKTPQAGDDSYSYLEDDFAAFDTVMLNVLANDLGGNAKKLYSIDDGDGALRDLVASNVTTGWEATADGNQIRINAGKIEFKLNFNVQTLTGNEPYVDSFVYAIRLGNGTLSYATVRVLIEGQNDVATISDANPGAAAAGQLTVTEDAASQEVSGKLNVADIDRGENSFQAAAADDLAGKYGSFSFNASTGEWSFKLDNNAAQELGEGDTSSESFTVRSLDGTAEKTISVQIAGVNDAAVFTGAVAGEVTEDGTASAGGSLSVTDADLGEAGFKAADAAALQGAYGVFSFDAASGAWTYTLDNEKAQALTSADAKAETLTVESLDGTRQAITVTVRGADEAPAAPTDPTRSAAPAVVTTADDPNDQTGSGSAASVSSTRLNEDNVLTGTSGDDVIDAKNGSDTVYGGAGSDVINAGQDADLVYGGAGNDTIEGDAQNDNIYGGSGNDTINGGEGDDQLVGGYGADVLTGKQGQDVFHYLDTRDTGDSITDFNVGEDKIDFSGIDANSATAGNDSFQLVSGMTLQANSVNWFVENGNTVIQIDTDGNTSTAEFELTLVGTLQLDSANFVL